MFSKQLRNDLSILHEATMTQLAKVGMTKYVQEGSDFNSLLIGTSQKTLNLYRDEQLIYDIIISAYTKVFVTNLQKNFKYFNGIYEGQHYTIQQYISRVFKNALIDFSNEALEEIRNRKYAGAMEGESDDEAFNRVTMGQNPNLKTYIPRVDDEEVTFYIETISQYEHRLQNILAGVIAVSNKEKSIKFLNRELDKLYAKLDQAEGLDRQDKVIDPDLDERASHLSANKFEDAEHYISEDLLFNKLKERFTKQECQVFDFLLAGFQQTEIAIYREDPHRQKELQGMDSLTINRTQS